MATAMLLFRPAVVRASINTADNRRSDQGRKTWWAPLFGFSPEPDYLNKSEPAVEGDHSKAAKTRFAPGSFTEEKAKQLRRMTNDASSFHDPMYHSAIASRLASDFSGHGD